MGLGESKDMGWPNPGTMREIAQGSALVHIFEQVEILDQVEKVER